VIAWSGQRRGRGRANKKKARNLSQRRKERSNIWSGPTVTGCFLVLVGGRRPPGRGVGWGSAAKSRQRPPKSTGERSRCPQAFLRWGQGFYVKHYFVTIPDPELGPSHDSDQRAGPHPPFPAPRGVILKRPRQVRGACQGRRQGWHNLTKEGKTALGLSSGTPQGLAKDRPDKPCSEAPGYRATEPAFSGRAVDFFPNCVYASSSTNFGRAR